MKLAIEKSSYKPPQKCLDQYKDPEFFNYQYQQYIEQLSKMNEDEVPAFISKASKQPEEDREDHSYSQQTSDASYHKQQTTAEQSSQNDIINITSCEFPQFAEYMSKQYGAAAFKQGFQIVKSQ